MMNDSNTIILKIILPEKQTSKKMKTISDIKTSFVNSVREKIEGRAEDYEIILHFPPDILVTDETRTIQSYNMKPMMECTMKRKNPNVVGTSQVNSPNSSGFGINNRSTLEEKRKTAQHISDLMKRNPERFGQKLAQLDKTRLASLVMILGYAIASEVCDGGESIH